MAQACDLGWHALAPCTPWGDTFEGFSPMGRAVCFERNYMWEAEAGGDIRVVPAPPHRDLHGSNRIAHAVTRVAAVQ